MLFGSFSCLMTIMSKRPMSSIFVSNPLNDDSRLFAFPIRLFENTIHPAPLAGSCQHPLLENPLFADYTAYTYVFFCYAPMIPHVSSKSVVCFHILLGVGHKHPPEKKCSEVYFRYFRGYLRLINCQRSKIHIYLGKPHWSHG